MATQQQVIAKYVEAFRRRDVKLVQECLTDDVVWVNHGRSVVEGREGFDAEVENPATTGNPALRIDRMIEAGNTVVATGVGTVELADGGGPFEFVFSDVYTFRDGLISRLESYHVYLTQLGG